MKAVVIAFPAVLGLIGLALCSTQEPQPGNLVDNPGFEAGEGIPPGWYWDAKNAAKGTAVAGTDGAKLGKLGLTLRPSDANKNPADPLSMGQAIPAAPYRGKTLYLSAWTKATGATRAIVGVYLIAKDGLKGSARVTASPDTPSFTYDQNSVKVPEDGSAENIILLCSADGLSGAASFDDVYLSIAPRVAPPASPKNTVPMDVAVRVSPRKAIRVIPRDLFGTNIEWAWNGNWMWDPETTAWKPELLKLAKDLGPAHVRFPGGTFSDFYHWRDGIGPVDQRATNPPMPGSDPLKHLVGTDEAIAFVNSLKSSLLITANVGTGTPEEAADWVRYVGNKAPVTFWEIGNEVYIHDDSPAAKASGMTAEAYAEKCSKMVDAMRAVDPKIRLGAITDENYMPWVGNRDWTKTVLGKVGDRIDFLSLHCAYAPVLMADFGDPVRDVYRNLFAAPIRIRDVLQRTDRAIASLPQKDANRIKIAVTEWGPLFQLLPSGRYVDHCKTLGSALFMSGVLKTFLEEPRVGVASQFKLTDPSFIGLIGFHGSTPVTNPSFDVLRHFAKLAGWTVVVSSVASPTYNSPAVGWVPATESVPWVQTVAARSPDGKRLTVVVINRQFDRPASVSLYFDGISVGSVAKLWTLTGDAVDSHTEAEPIQIPNYPWAVQAKDGDGQKRIRTQNQTIWLDPQKRMVKIPPLSLTFLEVELR